MWARRLGGREGSKEESFLGHLILILILTVVKFGSIPIVLDKIEILRLASGSFSRQFLILYSFSIAFQVLQRTYRGPRALRLWQEDARRIPRSWLAEP
jgi:hypothetical protein